MQLQSAFQLGTEGAVAAGLTNILEDPLGTPGRAITGAAFGGTLGAIAPSLRNPLGIAGVRASDSMNQARGAYATTAKMASDRQMFGRAAEGYVPGRIGPEETKLYFLEAQHQQVQVDTTQEL